jgi:hypothetical protein
VTARTRLGTHIGVVVDDYRLDEREGEPVT